ncbi:NlpC/P60 family protein [Bacillus mangrovi]|uniref:NlpC/P60 family protein n=1 Tax=Metabacillus mangrovi TaxID=1491830 RepID=A0A7X2V6F5_9BACI|nr:C40 family peptidase [Metabacillus mangrovi]MTH55033.1 NlpC/P60 family protein [Metabacillus mangrovi]
MKKKWLAILSLTLAFSTVKIYSAEAASVSKEERIVQEAKRYIGTPYRYGGTTVRGFDCSGFVGYTFKKSVKKVLPRTAADMYKKGSSISKSKLKKGDLIFFRTSSKKSPSHVGIYTGSGKFIHASSSRGVRVDSLSNSYWKPKYVGAKRN